MIYWRQKIGVVYSAPKDLFLAVLHLIKRINASLPQLLNVKRMIKVPPYRFILMLQQVLGLAPLHHVHDCFSFLHQHLVFNCEVLR